MSVVKKDYVRPVDFKNGRVDMSHGAGGRAMAQLIDELFVAAFDNEWLRQLNDQACFAVPSGRMVMATDSHVVSPLFFPGGDIGCLAVHGTINDVAMSGARPLYLSTTFILEEGFALADLKRIVESMAAASRDARVPIITGDTKVVEQGNGDGVFITTTAVGIVPEGIEISADHARPGDKVLVSGTLGDHGVAIMSFRENLEFETTIRSDTAALHGLVAAMVAVVPTICCLRDPTRGGLAATLNEFAHASGVGFRIREQALPVRPEVHAACEFLGLDPLNVANEGKLVAVCAPEDAARLLNVMRAHPLGRESAIIGEAIDDPQRFVQMETVLGGARMVDWLAGEQLPKNLLMRILLLTHAFNSLAQRLYVELVARGHQVSVEFDVNDRVTEEAVRLFDPDLIVAPFLKRAIPESIWRNRRCIVIHPGIVGDRGPSSLDWAVQQGEVEWGVTAIEATGELDAGPIWASIEFPMRAATKGSLYRNEVTEAAVKAMLTTLDGMRDPHFRPEPLDYAQPGVRGKLRPLMKQADRAIDWSHDTCATVLAKLRAADGTPGVLDELYGEPFYLYDPHPEDTLRGGEPGTIIARRDGAILRATVDGAVWIGHLKRKSEGESTLKLPATMLLGDRLVDLPEVDVPLWDESSGRTYREVWYQEAHGVGYVHFAFYNGAISTKQCERLRQAIRFAKTRPTRVIALMGGPDFWCNGIHLGAIEASVTPADESWANINAIDDVAREILSCDHHLTVAALQGNAGAGGVFLALAADRVLARSGVVLNPHYKGMGNLYGSEYWTYLLPKRVASERARAIIENRLPLGASQAVALGLLDQAFGDDVPSFVAALRRIAQQLAAASDFDRQLRRKRASRAADEAEKPLESYRAEELERLKLNFYGFDPSYHVARYHFMFKVPKSRTPLYLARHRAGAAVRAAA